MADNPFAGAFSGSTTAPPPRTGGKANTFTGQFTPGEFVAPPPTPGPKKQAPPPAGPTSFWARIAQVGIGKVNALNAYKTVVEHQPAVQSNNSPLKTAGKVAKSVGGAAVQSEKAVADPIARVLPGGQNDIKANDRAISANTKFSKQITDLYLGGKIDRAHYDKLHAMNKANASDTTKNIDALSHEIVKETNAGTIAAGAAGTVLDVLTAGAGKLVTQGGKYTLEQGVKKGAIKTVEDLASRVPGKAAIATASAGAGAANAKAGGGSGKQATEQAAAGAAIPLVGPVVKTVVKGGSKLISATGRAISRSDAQAGKTAASDAVMKHNLDDVLKTTKANVVDQSQSAKINVNRPNAPKMLSAPSGKAEGAGFTMAPQVDPAKAKMSMRLNQINNKLTKVASGKIVMHPDEVKALAAEKQSIYNKAKGVTSESSTPATPAVEKTGQKAKLTQAAKVESTPEVSTSQKITKPTTPKEDVPLTDTNKGAAGGVSGVQEKVAQKFKLEGALNPEIAAARAGHTDFATALRNASADDQMAMHTAHSKTQEFERLYHGGPDSATHGAHTEGKGVDFLHQVEQQSGDHQAHKFFADSLQDTGSRAVKAGVIDAARDRSYVPRYARFNDNRGAATVGGLKKTGGFSKGRVQAGEYGEGGDKYKSFGEFKTAVEGGKGKVVTNPVDIFHHTLSTRERAIAHSNSLNRFEKTAMNDGNPAVVTYNQSKGLPIKYQQLGYDTSILDGRAVHPDAVHGIKSLVGQFNDNPALGALTSINSKAKRLVTINGLVHAKNFVLASMRKQGIFQTAKALSQLRGHFQEADITRAIQHGWVPFEGAKTNLFDEATRGEGKLGKALGPLGKIRDKNDKLLFEGIGNRLSMSTYLHTEKAAIKAGMNPTEAGVIAARAAKNVGFISSTSESSHVYRELSRVAFFAGQFLKSTLKEGTTALGLSRDNTLSKGAQSFEQRQATKSLARGFMYLFTAAQGMNMATTGHPTWQNKDSKLSPVFHIDPVTGKEYHLTNFYGQIGELMHIGDPKSIINKLSPGVQTGSEIVANYQQYKGQQVYDKNASGPKQWVDIFKTALAKVLTPAGISTADTSKYTGPTGQPGKVTAAQVLGYGTSSKDQNAMERDIMQRRNNALPAGGSPPSPQLTALKNAARNDLRKGKTSSPNLDKLSTSMSAKDFKAFTKTGGQSDVQTAFDKLPTEQKIEVINKYSPKQLSELDLTSIAKALVGSSAKTTYESLAAKGYTDQQIKDTLNKAGFGSDQLQQIKDEAKAQAKATSRASRYAPKWQNPLLGN